jgi:TonB-linked SusC/RagA family outer membrane protein
MKKLCMSVHFHPGKSHQNLWLTMKLTTLLLLFNLVQVTANEVLSQKAQVSLNASGNSIAEVLDKIEKQTSYLFFYNRKEVNVDKEVALNVNNVSVSQVLNMLFTNSDVEYSLVKDYIVLTKKNHPTEQTLAIQQTKITGKVTDATTGEALPGVSVAVDSTSTGTVTDIDGNYSIEVAFPNAKLIFSYVGYLSEKTEVSNRNTINVALSPDIKALQEVVVIGYGTTKKEDLSAAVAVVKDMDKLKESPVLNIESMLQGRVAGVTIVNQGGHPNSTPSVTIRGTGSKTESVLYVVDGVPDAPYNPEDVESITILKDAASAAIYGAHAGAAGVFLITTRQAKKGKPSVEYSGFYGLKSAWRLPQSLTADKEAEVANLAYTNAGLATLDGWDITKNPYVFVTRTDWIDEIFRTAQVQRHTVTINGGTDKMTSMFQARYENEEGTLLNTYNKNISLRFNSSYEINKYVHINEDMFWNNNDNRGTGTSSGYTGTILSAIYMPRSATVYYDDGTFGGVGPRDSEYLGIHGDVVNPVASLLRNKGYVRNSDLISTSELHLTNVIKGLEVTSRFSYRAYNSFYKYFSYKRTEPGKPNDENYLTYSTGKQYKWLWENTINYNRIFGKHNIGLMASTTSKEDGARAFGLTARDFDREDEWAQFLVNAQTFTEDVPWDSLTVDRNLSYVSRVAYSFADRYFVTASYRRDIAGRLAANNRSQDYPGVTGAWKITSEPWFKVSFINLLKVRASWGKIGNLSSIGLYYGYPSLTSSYTYQIGDGAPYSTAAYVANAYNSKLSWETSEQTDIGLDIDLFNKKLNITTDYFWKRTYDLIKTQDTKWTSSYGVGAPLINQGEISNRGLEFTANWSDKIGEFTYSIGANFATLRNRVTYIDGNSDSYWSHTDSWRGTLTPFRSKVGEPYYSYWLVKTDGIFQSEAEVNAHAKDGELIQPNAQPGDLRFVDQNDDGSIDDDDRVYMGNAFPKVTYGFSVDAGWKNWDISLLFQGVGGVKLFHAFKESTLNASEQGYNRWDKILDAWSTTNTGSDIPRISASDANKNFGTISDWYLEDGDYLRLKNFTIGYTFKKIPWTGKLKLYFSGENLLTFTKYSGMDPEVGGVGLDGGQYPISRIFAIGAKANF